MENNTKKLANYCLSDLDHLPADVIRMAKLLLLDTLGCMEGGSRTAAAEPLLALAKELGGTPQATVVGLEKRTNCVQATYINAALADILDYEDTFLGHPAASIIPAALAAGEMVRCTGAEFIKAIVAGFEVSMRIALAVKPRSGASHLTAGVYYFHGFGAAAAAGMLLETSVDQLEHAFGITAAHTPLPIWLAKWGHPLHWVKNNFAGQTAAGFMGVLLAKKDFLGPLNIFDHPLGFWRMVGSDRYDPEILIQDLGKKFIILEDTFKPYPCCRWLHTTLDAISNIVSQHPLDIEKIKEINVRGTDHLPNFAQSLPESIVDMQFNLPYTIAVLLAGLPAGDEWFLETNLKKPEIVNTMNKVKITADPKLEAFYQKNQDTYPAHVEIITSDGDVFTARVDVPGGSPTNPLEEKQLRDKFFRLAIPSLGEKKAKEILGIIENLEQIKNVNEITRLLV